MSNNKPSMQIRQVVLLDEDLSRRIDAYWHAAALQSRAAAVRELLSLALDWAVEHPEPKGKQQ